MLPLFSVVVPVYNSRWTIDLLLRGLEVQSLDHSLFECILVDDGSTDGSLEFMRSCRTSFKLQVLSNAVNLGRSATRNAGCRAASGNVLVFLDSDVIPAPRWLESFSEAFDDEDAVVVSGRRLSLNVGDSYHNIPGLLGVDREKLFLDGGVPEWSALSRLVQLGPYPDSLYELLEKELRIVCQQFPDDFVCAYSFITSNVAVRKQAFDQTSGFDRFLRRGEDTDLGACLWEINARFGFAESAEACHFHNVAQKDRGWSLAEQQAFFHRHPYNGVLLVYLWSIYNSPGAPPLPSPNYRSLAALVADARASSHLDLEAHLRRFYRGRGFISSVYDAQSISEFCAETLCIDRSMAETFLDYAVKRGMICRKSEGRVYLDLHHAINCLRRLTPLVECELRDGSFIRNHKTLYQQSRRIEDLASVAMNVRYAVVLPTDALNSPEAMIHVPLPLPGPFLSRLKFKASVPDGILAMPGVSTGLIRIPVSAAKESEGRIEYEFECVVHETARGARFVQNPEECAPSQLTSNLRPLWSGTYLDKARNILKRIFQSPPVSKLEAAKQIYEWVLECVQPKDNRLPDYDVVDSGLGTCVQRTRLFIVLCQLIGLPARERCGALLNVDDKYSTSLAACTRSRGISPFSHTWCEIYTREHQWLPVEFIGWSFGKRVLTANNVREEAMREQLRHETPLYDDYYFGGLDPYRIHTSPDANKFPSCPAVFGKTGWQILERAMEGTRHQLYCVLPRQFSRGDPPVELLVGHNGDSQPEPGSL